MKNLEKIFITLSEIRSLLSKKEYFAAVAQAKELASRPGLPDFVINYLQIIIKSYQFARNNKKSITNIKNIQKTREVKSNGLKGEKSVVCDLKKYVPRTPFINALHAKGIFITNVRAHHSNNIVINAFTTKTFTDLTVKSLSGSDDLIEIITDSSNGVSNENWIRINLQCPQLSLGLAIELSFFNEAINSSEKIQVYTGSLKTFLEIATQCNDILMPPFLSAYSTNQLLRASENDIAQIDQHLDSDSNSKFNNVYVVELVSIGYIAYQVKGIEKEALGGLSDYTNFAKFINSLKRGSCILFLEGDLVVREDLIEYIINSKYVEEEICSGKAMLFNHLISYTKTGEVFSSSIQSGMRENIYLEKNKVFSCKACIADTKSLIELLLSPKNSTINDIHSLIDIFKDNERVVVNNLFMAGICFLSALPREQERCIKQDLSHYLCQSLRKKCTIPHSKLSSVTVFLMQNNERRTRIMEAHYENILLNCIAFNQEHPINPVEKASKNTPRSSNHSSNLLIKPESLLELIQQKDSDYIYFASQDYQELGSRFFQNLSYVLNTINNSCSVSALTLVRKSLGHDFSSILLAYSCSVERDFYPRLSKYLIPYALAPKITPIQIAPFYGTLYRTSVLKECLKNLPISCTIADFQIVLSIFAHKAKLLQMTTTDSLIAYTNEYDILLSDRASPMLANQILQSTLMSTTPLIRTHFKPKYD